MVLPLLPALTASSPFVGGRPTGSLDNRLEAYCRNTARIPSVAGAVIPEPSFDRRGYEKAILGPMYRDIAPFDREGTLRHEWLNARGAIARFDRGSIEIRLMDVQECPLADLAICALVIATLEALVAERWTPLADLQRWPVDPLAAIFRETVAAAERTEIRDADYLAAFGLSGEVPVTAGGVWRHLADTLLPSGSTASVGWRPALELILDHGTLARRILAATGPHPSPGRLRTVYGALCDCLDRGELFRPTTL